MGVSFFFRMAFCDNTVGLIIPTGFVLNLKLCAIGLAVLNLRILVRGKKDQPVVFFRK